MSTGPGWNPPDPFAEGGGPFIASGPHGLAVEAILSALGSGERLIHLTGAAGTGKTRVVEAVARAWREPGRRAAICDAGTGLSIPGELARLMSGGTARSIGSGDAWPRLAELARLAKLQRQRWLLVLDRAEAMESAADLSRLSRMDARGGSAVAVLVVRQANDAEPEAIQDDRATMIRLPAMTRTEAALYLAAKLSAGGWPVEQIRRDAVARLHAEARGVPRRLDQLARRVLAASAGRAVSVSDLPALLESADSRNGWAA